MNKMEAAGRALEVLDRDGWVQFDPQTLPLSPYVGGHNVIFITQGRVCAGMAIQRAAQEDGQTGQSDEPLGIYYELLMTLNMRAQDLGHYGIAAWNDDPGTSLEDVKLEIKRAGAA